MCGIVGIVSSVDQELLDKMLDLLEHRGPDDRGTKIFNEDRISLGHRRLSILDLSPLGHQPMSDLNEEIWIVFNGEVYNFQDIRKELIKLGYKFKSNSDTEVIIYAYKEWKYKCLEKFNGMFAFAIWDKIDKSLFIARDRLGIKPLYYAEFDNKFMFASEMKSILAYPNFPKILDKETLQSKLLFGWVPDPKTPFENIKKLIPGEFLVLKDSSINIENYWDISVNENDLRSEGELVEELRELLKDSVRLQMIADVQVGAFLSGGLDSSTLIAEMVNFTNKPIKTYTISFSEEDQKHEKMPDDSKYAKIVADCFNTDHKDIPINPNITELLPKMSWHIEDMVVDTAAINTYLISKYAKESGVTVLLNGMGGDEVFGGYRKYLSALFAQNYRNTVPFFLRKGIVEPIVKSMPIASSGGGFKYLRWAKRFFKSASLDDLNCFLGNYSYYNSDEMNRLFTDDFKIPFNQAFGFTKHKEYFDEFPNVDYLTKMCYLDTKTFLTTWNLNYSDKASMAASVEGRPPLIDHRIVEFMFNLPPKYRINGRTQKYLLKKAMEGSLPNEIIYRPKAPFGAPLRSWMQGALYEMFNDYYSESSVKSRGIFNYSYIKEIIEKNKTGKEDYGHRLWNLLNIEVWFKTFVV